MGKKRILPLQPPHTTPYYAFAYFTIFFACVEKSFWLPFLIPYAIVNGIGYIILKINTIKSRNEDKEKVYGQKRNYGTFILIAAFIYISIWQSMYNTSYEFIDMIIIAFLVYSHLCVIISFMHFYPNLFAKFTSFRQCIGWIAELHYNTIIYSLYVFPVYPIIAFYIQHDVMDRNQHKYAVFIIYSILYCYILYSLFISLTPSNPNIWTYYKLESPTKIEKNANAKASKPIPLKFKQYYVGTNALNSNKFKLRVCQISDCHVDTPYTANELKRLCQHVVKFNPDLVLLTGDFYYTKNDDIPKGLLKYALSPLTELADKCYACLGNHDIKTKKTKDDIESCIVSEFKKLNIKLLRNESVLHDENTEIIGFDFVKDNKGNKRSNMMKNVLKESKLKIKLNGDALRIVLLHNPFDFDDFDGDENILVFSGHVHGGHVGFYALGSWFRDRSLLRMLFRNKSPQDYGVWRKGNNLMYIHRANTLYSKGLLRFGIPAEQQSCILIT